jgi:hypothetical protein
MAVGPTGAWGALSAVDSEGRRPGCAPRRADPSRRAAGSPGAGGVGILRGLAPPDKPPGEKPPGSDREPDEAPAADAGASGSIDVQFSGTALPAAASTAAQPAGKPRRPAAAARTPAPELTDPGDETPAPLLTPPPEPLPAAGRARRTSGKHRTLNLPGKLGEIETRVTDGLHEIESRIGEQLSHLPGVPKTRKSRVLVRSIVVGFLLVFTWIAAIVWVQLQEKPAPDFRPLAEKVLVALRDGKAAQVYDQASPRFQEVVLEERFVDDMTEMTRTLGRFLEITSVDETEVTEGPGGRTGRVGLRLLFEKGQAAGNVSFHWDEQRWKVLGVSFDMPDTIAQVESTAEKREERVRAPPEIRPLVEATLEQLRDGKVEQVWNAAAPVFTSSVTLAGLVTLEKSRRDVLGVYRRILDVTSSRQNPGQTSASLDALVEYDKGVVSATFGFAREGGTWKLASYKLVLPKPRVPSGAR